MEPLAQSEITAIIAKVGQPRANGGKIVLDIDRIQMMRKAGFSMRQIAEYLGVSRTTVYRRYRDANLWSSLQLTRRQ